jgi:nitrogen fixation NifU-like protein
MLVRVRSVFKHENGRFVHLIAQEHIGALVEGDHMSDRAKTVEQRQALYSAKVIVESSNPSNRGRMPDPDACGIIHGCCGDTMGIYLRLNGNRIEEATFTTDGHESAVACGSMLTKMLRGMSLEAAGRITPEDLIAALDGLPKAKVHCANLTLNTLREAMANRRAEEKA